LLRIIRFYPPSCWVRRRLPPCSFGLSASSTFLSQQTNNQPAVLFSQNKPAPAISHQPTEQAVLSYDRERRIFWTSLFHWHLARSIHCCGAPRSPQAAKVKKKVGSPLSDSCGTTVDKHALDGDLTFPVDESFGVLVLLLLVLAALLLITLTSMLCYF
jgi:hypothetical protein